MEENYEEFDLAKWLAGEMTESELAAFEQSPGYATYAKIRQYSAQLKAPGFDQDTMYEKVIAKPQAKVIPLYKTVFRVAAVLVIGLGLFFASKFFMSTTETAQNGEFASFSLPDDSQVVLNAGSEIDYKKWDWDNHRTLQLDGEAYFKVAKGKKFEVNTNLGKVTVLGTQFDVKARNGRFDVSCYEGRVRVNYGNSEVVITKGQSAAFSNGNSIEVPENNGSGPEWLNNKLMFNKETLANIVGELNRQYNVDIRLEGSPSAQLFTGTLPLKKLDEALQILSSIYHLQPVKENGRIILQTL